MNNRLFNRVISLGAVAVGTTPTKILTEAQQNTTGLRAVILDADGALSFGDASVTVAGGIRLAAAEKITLEKNRSGDLYAIASVATTVRVLLGCE